MDKIAIAGIELPVHEGCFSVREAANIFGLNPQAAVASVSTDEALKEFIQKRRVQGDKHHVCLPVHLLPVWAVRLKFGKNIDAEKPLIRRLRLDSYEMLWQALSPLAQKTTAN